MDHRGRFQAQGGGIEESEPWNEPDPTGRPDGPPLTFIS